MRANPKILKHPFFLLAFVVLAIISCRTDQVDVPDLTGPSGANAFLTIEANPDALLIRKPGVSREKSSITIQFKNQQGQGIPNASVKVRIENSVGSEINIGTLSRLQGTTDSGGFLRLTYTAPNSAEQFTSTRIYIHASVNDAQYANQINGRRAIDLDFSQPPVGCVFGGPGAPSPDFTFTPNPPIVKEEVCFDAQASTDDGIIVASEWDFGDGGHATGLTACHTYNHDGIFNVTLVVQDNDHNCSSITQSVEVSEGTPPTCTFTVSPTPVIAGEQETFNATLSTDEESKITSFKWDFGDGTPTASGKTVNHTFTDAGSFVVTLTTTDNAGNQTSCTQTITVTNGQPPTCSFTISPNPPILNSAANFDASTSSDPDGTIVSYEWNFGEGGGFTAPSASPTTTHTYTTTGARTVTLRITDDKGNVVTCQQSFTVGNLNPVCDTFTADNTSVSCGTTVNFTVTAHDPDGSVARVDFNTPNGTPPLGSDSSSPFNFASTYNTAGNFNANATVVDNLGATSTGTGACPTIPITVTAVVPSISISDETVTEGNSGTTTMTFTISLSEATCVTVSVTATTADGTATAPSDYLSKSQLVSIPAGSTSATFDVTINGDTDDEGASENFTVNLTNATNGTITDAQGVGTITDDDP